MQKRWISILLATGLCSLLSCSEELEKPEFSICGNGEIENGEECDDGNKENNDECSNSCTIVDEPKFICGDGKVEGDEECDDGNKDDGDGCSASCQIEEGYVCSEEGNPCVKPECGNGKVEGDEECDDGNDIDDDECSNSCQKVETSEPECGDGKVEGDEKCDDGNKENDDGCAADCQTIEDGYQCPETGGACTQNEPDDSENNAVITPNPGPKTTCGDGKLEAGETCEPNYIFSLDGEERTCTSECTLSLSTDGNSNCGTGTVEDDEECDDGNQVNGDGCSSKCKEEDENKCQMKNGAHAMALLVVDGDTLKIKVTNDGRECEMSNVLTVRMHGIDSPECKKVSVTSPVDSSYSAKACEESSAEDFSDKTENEKGGYEASKFVNDLVFSEENNGKLMIECETRSAEDPTCLVDATSLRYLAYIKLKKDGAYVDLAKEIISAGYGMAYTDFTSQRIEEYCTAEQTAVEGKTGVWSYGESFESVVTEHFNEDKNRWLLDENHCK